MEVGEIAEDFMVYVSLPAHGRRRQIPGGWLVYQPGPVPQFANVSGLRAGSVWEVDSVAAEAASWFKSLGRRDFVWFIGPHSRPTRVVDHLLGRGAMVLATSTSMTLDRRPEAGASAGVTVKEVGSAAELFEYWKLIYLATGPGMDVADAIRQRAGVNEAAWEDHLLLRGARRCYLAYVGGTPVAAGGVAVTAHGVAILTGGATLPQARGHGCYRSLLVARWDAAVAAGCRHLAVVASNESRPILARTGFTAAGEVTFLRQTL